MSSLAEGMYELSSFEKSVGDKTVIFVKLTDSALKSIEEYVPSNCNTILKPTIQFYNANGVLKLPNKGKYSKCYGFTLSGEGEGSQGSFECLHHERTESLESLGCMLLKMQINAKEDTYEKTRVKMAAVEEENKKFCTKEIDPSGPYVGKKIKIKRPMTSVPKLCPQLYKVDKVSQRTLFSGLPAVGSPGTSLANEPTNEHNIEDYLSKESFRKKNHILKKDEQVAELFVNLPSFPSDYGSTEKRNAADILSLKQHFKKQKVSGKHSAVSETISNDDGGFIKPQTNEFDNVDCNEGNEPEDFCSLENMKYSSINSFGNEKKEQCSAVGVKGDEKNSECAEMNIKNSFIDPVVTKNDSPCNMLVTEEEEYEHLNESLIVKNKFDVKEDSLDAENCHREEQIHTDEQQNVQSSLSFVNDKSRDSPGFSSHSMDGLNSDSGMDFSEDTFPTLEYVKQYIKITSQQQRECYKADFDAEYEQYKVLHNVVKRATLKFATLENELKRYEPGSEKYIKIREHIYQEYFRNAHDEVYQEAKRKLHFLHKKLSHIKKLVMEYDGAFATEL